MSRLIKDGGATALLIVVDRAQMAGREAYQASCDQQGDRGAAGFAYVTIPNDRHHRELVEHLHRRRIGGMMMVRPRHWRVDSDHFAAPGTIVTPNEAACVAFADVLREAGFRPQTFSKAD